MAEEDIRRNSYPVIDQAPLPSFHKPKRFQEVISFGKGGRLDGIDKPGFFVVWLG